MININTIYNENCLTTMKHMEDNSIDLVVTSPPYEYGKNKLRNYTNDNVWTEEQFKEIANELYRIVKDGGVVVWIVNDQTVNGSESLYSFKQALYFNEIGFNVNDTMIWLKTNPMPVISQPRYNPCFEYMFVFSKGKPKTFNPIKVECKSYGTHYKSTCKNMGGENGRTQKDFFINKVKNKNNVWEIAVAQNKTNGKKHPAVFPLQLAKDHILSWSSENDIVYDPFMGSGTTAVACKLLNRKYIGSEISKDYCDIIDNRLSDIKL